MTVSICHGERRPNEPTEQEREDESNHPDNASLSKCRIRNFTETSTWIPAISLPGTAEDAEYI